MSRSKEHLMSGNELKSLLDLVDDTRELVLRREAGWTPVRSAWGDARDDADAAYREWGRARTRAAYAGCRAAQDREGGAEDARAGSGVIR